MKFLTFQTSLFENSDHLKVLNQWSKCNNLLDDKILSKCIFSNTH